MNFDGNTIGNPAIVGIGGVVWDSNASHALYFSGPLGFFLVNRTELLVFKTGLWKALRFNLCGLLVAGDLLCHYSLGV